MAKVGFTELINGEQPILIDFFATWCGPCKMLAPILKEVKADLGVQVRVIKIDVDKNEKLVKQLGIMSMPTLQLYQNGELLWETMGVQTKQAIVSHVLDKIKSPAAH